MTRKRKERSLGIDRGDERDIVSGRDFDCAERSTRADCLWESWRGDISSPSVAEEIHRYKRICGIREHLLTLCGKGTSRARYPSLSFERWLMHAKALERGHKEVTDPVIPSIYALHLSGSVSEEETVLFSDLIKARQSIMEAKYICREVAKFASESMMSPQISTNGANVNSCHRKDGSLELSCTLLSNIRFSLPSHIVKKLRLLWRGEGLPSTNDNDCRSFNESVFIMLLRYQAIGGPGFQAALSYPIFHELQARGVTAEFFASPLNCFHTVFCSAFPDVDRVFGACCSFFDFNIAGKKERGGIWEANPPFSVPILNQTARKIQSLLVEAENTRIPLQIYVVVPDQWMNVEGGHSEFWDILNSSPYLVSRNAILDDSWINIQDKDGHILLKRRKIPTSACMMVLDSESTGCN